MVCVVFECFWTIWVSNIDGFSYKLWYVGRRHEVLWHIYSVFQISKKFRFCKGFPKNIDFSKFWGLKLKILKFRDSHFVERVILHLYWPFCAVCFKLYFWRILNIEPILVKIGVKWPHEKVNFSKKNSHRFRRNFVIRCQVDVG